MLSVTTRNQVINSISRHNPSLGFTVSDDFTETRPKDSCQTTVSGEFGQAGLGGDRHKNVRAACVHRPSQQLNQDGRGVRVDVVTDSDGSTDGASAIDIWNGIPVARARP